MRKPDSTPTLLTPDSYPPPRLARWQGRIREVSIAVGVQLDCCCVPDRWFAQYLMSLALHRCLHRCRRLIQARFVLLCAAVAIGGCASQPPLLPVADSHERWVFNGFSILPPAGTGWNWVGRKGQDRTRFFNATFVKKSGNRTYVAVVDLLDARHENRDLSDPDQLLRYVKTAPIMQEGPRQRNMRSDFRIDETLASLCVRFDFEAEDPGAPGGATIFDLDGHGFFCNHPNAEAVIARIAYTRRSPQGATHLAGREEGERFLNSLKFAEVHR